MKYQTILIPATLPESGFDELGFNKSAPNYAYHRIMNRDKYKQPISEFIYKS